MNRPLLGIVLLLSAFGILIMYSAGQTDMAASTRGFWLRHVEWKWLLQMIWITIGCVGAMLAYRVSFRLLEWATPWLYGLSLLLLALTLVAGTGAGTAASTKSWLHIGSLQLGQPAEFAKLATIMMLARWFTSRREPPESLRGLIPPILIAAIPALMVLKQHDLGSALVFGGILFPMLFWAGVQPRLLVLLASPVISMILAWSTPLWSAWMIALFILMLVWRPFVLEAIVVYLLNSAMGVIALMVWGNLGKYQQDRLLSYVNPELYRQGAAFQAIQSKVAIGSGGWFGTGFTQGPQKRTGYILQQTTDFIFAVLGEELGFLGVCAALGLFLGLLITLVQVARRASDPYASLVVFGIVGLILTHVFENVGMTVSLMPITGIPLPFFSYGGSFTIAIFLALGMAFRAASEERAASYVDA